MIEQAGGSLKDFTVLSPQVDPYRLDTPADHVIGRWFAEQMQRLNLLHRKLHLRGIHYARDALEEQLGDEHRTALHGYLAEQLGAIRAQLEEIESRARLSTADLEFELPPIEIPDPEVDESVQGRPLLSSRWPWAEQSRALIDRKRYINGSGAAP